jgi:hypothetical protein
MSCVTIDVYWIDNCVYWITVYTLQFTTVHTLYNSQLLSLFSSSEDFESSSATTAATNSYGIPCHHYPGNSTELCTILTQWPPTSGYIAREPTTKKTLSPTPLLLHDVITGRDPQRKHLLLLSHVGCPATVVNKHLHC